MKDRERLTLDLLREALDLDAAEQVSFLEIRCSEDPEMRERVLAMLARIAVEERGELPRLNEASVDRGPHVEAPAREPTESLDLLLGSVLGPFRIIERIGRGGMGIVYRGERIGADFSQQVAIKVIRRGFDFDDVHARFLRERRILARLDHPHLARFIDGGLAADGRPWFALEYVRGEPLTRWCDTRRFGVRERVRLFLDVCAAVQYAHTQLVIHRDLKPANILVDEAGSVRLVDFGVAGLLGGDDSMAGITATGVQPAMTPEYAAPEQFDGSDDVGVSADVYSLGVVLYELISGVLPFAVDRRNRSAVERAVRETPPQSLVQAIVRPDDTAPTNAEPPASCHPARLAKRASSLRSYRREVRGDITRIVETALAKEKERRYATVQALGDDLQRWLDGAPVRVAGNGFGYRLGKFIRRNRVAVAVASALAIGLVAMSVLALRIATLERQQRNAAVAEAARATAVRDYVQLMFRNAAEQPDSGKANARDALKRGAEQIFVQFKDEPEVGQATALSLSELYMQLGDATGGTALLERLLAWPGIENNPDVLAVARYNLAQLEYARGEKARARALLDQAQAWWNTDPGRHRDVLRESRTAQAQIERAEGHVDQAITTLEASIVERRNAQPVVTREVASALNALSLALAEVGRYDEAVQHAGEGYELLVKAGLGNDVTALALLNNRANALVTMGHPDTAVDDFRRVSEARRELYGRSPELASSQANLGIALVAQAKTQDGDARRATLEEAIRLLEDSYAMAIEGSGEKGRSTASIRYNLAEVYVLTGDYVKAEPLAEAAVRIGSEQFGEASPLAGLGLRARATLRAARGDRVGALGDIAAANVIFTGMGKGGERYLQSLTTIIDQIKLR